MRGRVTAPGRGAPTRRSVLVGAGLCVLSGGGLALLQDGRVQLAVGATASTPAARRAADPGCVHRVATTRPWTAITFDDGPDPAYTPHVLDLLAEHGARATFFVIGANAARHPDLVARMRREGHAVANHTHDHPRLPGLPEAEVLSQVARGRAVVGRGGGPLLLRPPVGETSRTVAGVAHRLGERQVFWTSCLEAELHDGAAAGGRALGETVGRGEIVLAHDGGHVTGRWAQTCDRTPTLEALPHLMRGLADRGLTSVTLADLMAAGTPC